jgi:hypothetical protein
MKLLTFLLVSSLLLGTVLQIPLAHAQDADGDDDIQIEEIPDEVHASTDAHVPDEDDSDDYVEYDEIETPMFAPSADVTTSVYFPEYVDKSPPSAC